MKNKLLIVIAALLLFIFIVYGTYAWYLFFLKTSTNYTNNDNNTLVSGKIVLSDTGSLYEDDADIIFDDESDTVVPYSFNIKNTGKDSKFTLFIEDVPVNSINDGCTEETLLEREQLKYQLIENDIEVANGYLSDINDNILYQNKISKNETIYYELRIYIHDNANNYEGKHYHYKIVMEEK